MDDIIGKKFNKWTVLSEAPQIGYRKFVLCRCDCGIEKEVDRNSVFYGTSKSCGCSRETISITHGHTIGTSSPEYRSWQAMKQRCYDPKNKAYKNYGGRGVKVCDRWLNSFENFLADMGNKPTTKHTLDRKGTNKDYTPNNCRWATFKEQGNNKRNTIYVFFNGETKTISEWADVLGFDRKILYQRYKRTGIKNFNKHYDTKN